MGTSLLKLKFLRNLSNLSTNAVKVHVTNAQVSIIRLNRTLVATAAWDDDRSVNTGTLKRFCEVFKQPEDVILETLKKCPQDVHKITTANLLSKIEVLTASGISVDSILRYPWLLAGGAKLTTAKLEMVRNNTQADLSSVLPLLKLSAPQLQQFLEKNKIKLDHEGNTTEKILIVAQLLQCDVATSCELLTKHKFLQTMPHEKMVNMVEFLQESGVKLDDIVKDPYILNYSTENVKPRIEEAKNAGMTNIKPWLARSKQDVFYRSLERYKAIQEHLGSDRGIEEFLMRRLKLESYEEIIEALRPHPRILLCSAKKLGTALDVLEKEGYTVEQIRRSPRVLTNSTKTIMGRIKILKDLIPNEIPPLYSLALSKREFYKFMKRHGAEDIWSNKN